MTSRNDIHSPLNLVTEDYAYVGAYDNHPPAGSYIGEGGTWTMNDDTEQQGTNWTNAKMRWLRGLIEAATTTPYHSGGQCDHCGAAIRYVAVVKHVPTGDHLAVGETCLDNRFAKATVDFQKMRKAAALDAKMQRFVKAWEAYRAEHTEADWAALDASTNSFVKDVLSKGRRYGNLSDKQLAAIIKAVQRDTEQAMEPVVEEILTTAPTGKGIVIEGEVLSVKLHEGYYGTSLKMLVKVTTDAGIYKVWGTVPASLMAERGDTVRFTANVEASQDDPAFGFYKRPRQATLVSAAAQEAPLEIKVENVPNYVDVNCEKCLNRAVLLFSVEGVLFEDASAAPLACFDHAVEVHGRFAQWLAQNVTKGTQPVVQSVVEEAERFLAGTR